MNCSYKIGARKAWPLLYKAAIEYKIKDILEMKSGGTIELCNSSKVEYVLPIENYEKFHISKIPVPHLKKGIICSKEKNL